MKPLQISILAVIFLVSGHFFMTAYADYKINSQKLELLSARERSVKQQIKGFERKKKRVEKVNRFVHLADRKGLTINQWDKFFVSLENEPFSFLNLQTTLDQTVSGSQYFFKPESLAMRRGYIKTDSETQPDQTTPDETREAIAGINPRGQSGEVKKPSDVIISMKGHFLVQKRRH